MPGPAPWGTHPRASVARGATHQCSFKSCLHCVSNPTASHLSANVSLLVSSISPFYLIICISNQTYYAFFYFKNKPSFLTPFPSSCCILAGSQGLGAGVAEQIRKAQKLGPFYLQACSTQPSPSH